MEKDELYAWLKEMNDQELPTSECEQLDKIEKRLAAIEMLLIFVWHGHNS